MRTTVEDVLEIIDTGLTDPQVYKYIEIANRMVTNLIGSSITTAATLKDIETFLTAHLIASTKERQAKTEKVEDVQVQYQGTFGAGLQSTTYGQMVITLDTSGKLEQAGRKKVVIGAIAQYPDNYD